jgi:hypothetical protein
MTVDQCSIWSYEEIVESGRLAQLHGMYLSLFSEQLNNPLTVNQVVRLFADKFKEYPYKTHHGLGSRISELEQMGFLKKFDLVKCEYTHKTVNRWIYTGRRYKKKKISIKVPCPYCEGKGEVQKEIYVDDEPKEQKELF